MNETHIFKKQTPQRIERINNASVENSFIIRAIHFRLIREKVVKRRYVLTSSR